MEENFMLVKLPQNTTKVLNSALNCLICMYLLNFTKGLNHEQFWGRIYLNRYRIYSLSYFFK